MTILVPLAVAILGLLAYFAGNNKVSEAGKIAYGAGLLVTLFELAGHLVTAFR